MTITMPSPFITLRAPEKAKEKAKKRMPQNMIMICEGHHPEELGLIPSFIDQSDPRPAREQFDTNYAHGGGWQPIPGFRRMKPEGSVLLYPDDPPYHPIAAFTLRDELIVVYDYGLVAIMQDGGEFEVARLD